MDYSVFILAAAFPAIHGPGVVEFIIIKNSFNLLFETRSPLK
jgi:hypothetical protein